MITKPGCLVTSSYKDEMNQRFITEAMEEFIRSNKKEIVFICIGTDKCIGDCLGPLVGTKLEELDIKVYGTLKEPIHALNIDNRRQDIIDKHSDAFFIGIDACLGAEEDIGLIILRDSGVKPGKGVGKQLPTTGNISIISIVEDATFSDIFFDRSIRLGFVNDIANKITEIAREIDSAITEYLSISDVALTNLEDKLLRARYGGVDNDNKEEF